ncbi:MAG: hypothetical protein E7195_09015 [Peptococcaceae bacterium]|nr:hypothetical protein [Peptococcaceae bacterium]
MKDNKIVNIIVLMCILLFISNPIYAATDLTVNSDMGVANTTNMLVTVNNIPVTQEEFDKRRALYQATGNPKTDQEIMDKLVDEKATISHAVYLGVEPTEKEVAEYMQGLYVVATSDKDTSADFSAIEKLDMTLDEYFEEYEQYFSYYKICIENVTRYYEEEAASLKCDKYDYTAAQRIQWKADAEVYNESGLTIDLNKQVINWEKVKTAQTDRVILEEKLLMMDENAILPLSDEPVGTSFSGYQRTNIIYTDPDYGVMNFPVSIDAIGRGYDANGYKWLNPTDVVIYRSDSYVGEAAGLFDQVVLTSVDAYRNGTFVKDYLSLFGNLGSIHDRLLPNSPELSRYCLTGKLSTSGTYYLDFVAIVFINTYNVEISCDTSTF